MSSLQQKREQYEMKRAKDRFIKIAFISIMVIGIALSVTPFLMSHYVASYTINHANEKLDKIDSEHIKQNRERIEQKTKQLGDSYGEISSIDPNISYNASNITSVSSVSGKSEVNPDYVVGELYIPSVELDIPVLEGLTNENLDVASGTMKPNQQMGKGNYAIAGHHMIDEDLLFTPLMKVKSYDPIYLTDKEKIYEYVVTDTSIIQPTEGQVIEDSEGEGIITLITCSDPEGTARLMMRGKFLKSYEINEASKDIKQAVNS